jgi:hypothetical protein
MLLWALTVFVTLIAATSLPQIQTSLQITGLRLQDWALVIIVPFVAMFWMELAKILRKST